MGQTDTVVVGAGSAGAVIAARATEKSANGVLLLEAGPDYPDVASVPKDLLNGTRNSMRAHDWGLRHRPNKGQILLNFPRGKVVGGSSAVNTCIALRGQPYDYDEWGLPEWTWDACLPAFKRMENDLDVQNEWHSQDGPIPIRRHTRDELGPWQAAFLDACGALGYPPCADTNDPTTTGYGPHAMNKVDGVRMSAARCYLTPAVRARENLAIRANTSVRRVVVKNRRVVGIEIERHGRVLAIEASRVVLAAGAIATPGILLRSGIGPRRTVERLGIELVADVPAVGARLLDHPGIAMFLRPTKDKTNKSFPLIQTVLRYTSEKSEYPNDMQLQPGSFVPLFGGAVEVPYVILMCSVGKPRGSGRLEWTSAREPPLIHSDLLHNDEDRARAAEAIELGYRCARTPEMRDLATPFWPPKRALATRASIAEWVGRVCDSGYHPCGTVPMGKDGDPRAAVDPYGRVRGVEGLFVADASIMPTIPSANTNLPTLMIGERFGAWFKGGLFD